MQGNLQSKLLLALSKSKKDKGFTLIELLVVIIIIGVLSAIALPNLLGQIGKARESEGKTNVGAIIRGQQAYRLEEGQFAPSAADLDVSIEGEFYSYAVSNADATGFEVAATEDAAFANDIRGFVGGAVQPAGSNFSSVICEDSAVATTDASVNLTADPVACNGGNPVN